MSWELLNKLKNQMILGDATLGALLYSCSPDHGFQELNIYRADVYELYSTDKKKNADDK